MMIRQAIEMIERLIAADPWATSQEGLDDYCVFCGSDHRYWVAPPGEQHWRRIYHHVHTDDCPWVTAHALLDRPLPAGHYSPTTKPEYLP